MTENITDGLILRQATTADAAAVAVLFDQYRIFYGQQTDIAGAEAYLQERLERGESVIFVAWDGETGQAAGFTQLYPTFSSISMQASWILNDLYVPEAFRQRGIARQLMNTAKHFAASTGAKGLALSTGINNNTAQRLYESLGYERDEDFYHYFYTV
ncbi:GNAT family N-acetyltransferase [Paenibacillus pinihumi]|uniref:GNAT family N-acetyltransferase n=1 Tax=Paenibacillus pinihumi TaxID=669462 RepID=UPI000410D00E|nr:GNAT family N-acetyltransferase [Paenibacillus pinihumi]